MRLSPNKVTASSPKSGMVHGCRQARATPCLRKIDGHVNLAELLQREIRERLHIGEVGHIERTILCRVSGCANFGGQFLQAVGAAGAEHDRVAVAAR